MSNQKYSTHTRRANVWNRYYRSKDPDRTSGDWITKECLNCDCEMILEPKQRNRKFCSLSCSTSYNNKKKASQKIRFRKNERM